VIGSVFAELGLIPNLLEFEGGSYFTFPESPGLVSLALPSFSKPATIQGQWGVALSKRPCSVCVLSLISDLVRMTRERCGKSMLSKRIFPIKRQRAFLRSVLQLRELDKSLPGP